MSSKVSVIVSNYNMGRFLPRAVKSISNQNYPSIEVIIADDGSQDNSLIIIEELRSLSRNGLSVVPLRLSHGGRASARNAALDRMSGDFVTFLDADDELPGGSLESRVSFLLDNPQLEGVFTDANQVGADGIISIRRPPNVSNEDLARMLISKPVSPLVHTTFMLKREVLEKAGKFDTSYLRTEDHDFAFRVLTRCNVGYLPVSSYNHHTSTHGLGERLSNRVVSGATRLVFIFRHTESRSERLRYMAKAVLTDLAKLGYEIFSGTVYTKRSLGQNGKPIDVYKFRTMAPEADLDLAKVLKNGLDELGKPINDDRITSLGKFLRRYWIDELPQLYNMLKGEISLVGIRPRREIDWQQYSEKQKERSLKYKPSLLPASYASLGRSFRDQIEAESRYLAEREVHPYRTQIKYFFLICSNIIFRGARGR